MDRFREFDCDFTRSGLCKLMIEKFLFDNFNYLIRLRDLSQFRSTQVTSSPTTTDIYSRSTVAHWSTLKVTAATALLSEPSPSR